jgi:AcrR family transcriptional regulator
MRPGSRRAATTEATRQTIITAAREMLALRRWAEFTVESVAQRAGVTRVTVYNQVGSKRGLLDAVLTDLTERARMDQLLTDTGHLEAAEARTEIVVRTCRFWHAERDILRSVFGLAGVDREVAAVLEQREQWRRDQLRHLLKRFPAERAQTPRLQPDDRLAAMVAVTSFPAYDRLGDLADDPARAAQVIDHLLRSVTEETRQM